MGLRVWPNQKVRFSFDTINDDGDPYNPGTIDFKLMDPAGTVTSKVKADFQNDAVGTWHVDIVLDDPGRWEWYVLVDDVSSDHDWVDVGRVPAALLAA